MNTSSDDLSSALGIVFCLERLGCLDQAETELKHLVEAWPRDMRPRYHLARISQNKGNFDEALTNWRVAVACFPQDINLVIGLASLLERLERNDEAEALYARAVEQWPDDVRPRCGQSRISQLRDAPDVALGLWQAVASDFPQSLMAALGLAECLEIQCRLDEAAEAFTRICQHWPQSARARCGHARMSELRKTTEEALAVWQNVAADFPRDNTAAIHMANCLQKLGRFEEALGFVEGILKRVPSHIGAQLAYLQIMIRLKRHEEAIDQCASWFNEAPAHQGLFGYYITLLRAVGHSKETVEHARLLHGKSHTDLFCKATLQGSLADLTDHPRRVNTSLIRTMWAAWQHADKSVWHWPKWRQIAIWGAYANWMLRVVCTCRPDMLAELDSMIIPPNLDALNAAIAGGNGCLLVGSHHGPQMVPTRFFDQFHRPFHLVSAEQIADRFGAPPANGAFVFSGNKAGTLKALVRAVRSGAICSVASDFGQTSDAVSMPLLGGTIHVSSMAPRIAFKFSIPTLWCHAFWQGNKIAIHLSRLPDPAPAELEDTFVERWVSAYLEHLSRQLHGSPENISFVELWRQL